MKCMLQEDPMTIRTVEKYKLVILNINTAETGIKEECAFDDLYVFHVLINLYADVMHDLIEGVAMYTMARIISSLTESGFFNMKTLNACILILVLFLQQ